MSGTNQLERWALERAHAIVLNEGMNLINAAQWLDKKRTVKSSQQLRDAIRQSLIEAVMLQMAPPPTDGFYFSKPSPSTFSPTTDPA
jgi:hypothetical protein